MKRRRLIGPPPWRSYQGQVRPLPVVPGDWPHLGLIGSQEEYERGQISDPRLGTLPATERLEREDILVDLRKSGARGVPLTVERRFRVLPTPPPGVELAPRRPASELTKLWPWIFPPGDEGAEFPIVRVNAPVVIAAGATATLIQIAELPRGMAGVIKKFGQTAADFTNLFWTILIKGRPADPIVGINFQFGQLFQPIDLPGSGIPLRPGDDIVVQALNSGGAGVAGVRARLDMYWWRS